MLDDGALTQVGLLSSLRKSRVHYCILSPTHTDDADATQLSSSWVASAYWIRN